ncbi:BLOC-3 complex member HPS1 isoform X2 [Penaeus vannamei]|uniref:BLOC-3 complex member HPS1 isoform X2 n=1 Tax=Penaeus vannamei TaxID=6689 RepID=UPI000F67EFB9|nr:Hermansky-Pudlak syndrome 1 protein homolog isoform X2 [Penaeus vannamei]
MQAVLIFDQLNDVVYLRCDHRFVRHVRTMAASQGLLQEQDLADPQPVSHLDPNIVVQIFSPLVTSQRIMATQFNNPYTSVTCQDGTTVVFQEYAGYLFVGVGHQEECHLQRLISMTIRMVQLVVGPCVTILKRSATKSALLDSLLEAWQRLYSSEQSYLVEAVERLVVNSELSAAAVKALASVVDKMKAAKELTPCHAMFFVRSKLLALYSSRNAQELSASDLLFLNLLVEASQVKELGQIEECETDNEINTETVDHRKDDDGIEVDSSDSGEFYSIPSTPSLGRHAGLVEDEQEGKIRSCVLLLHTEVCHLTPHLVHYETLSDGLALVIVSEINRTQLSVQLITLLTGLEEMLAGNVNSRGKLILDACDTAVRKSLELAKRLPRSKTAERIEKALQQVHYRWENVKKSGVEDWLRTASDAEVPTRVDASLTSLVETTRAAWRTACLAVSSATSAQLVESAVAVAADRMADYCHFLEVKALRNMTLGCRSALTINKYLEEFPGLVHFLYVDRSSHQLTSPTLLTDEAGEISKELEVSENGARALTVARVWSMVEFARSHLAKGHLSLMWKDTTFSYAYFLWFEDGSGNPLKPGELDETVSETLPLPGVLCEDFYRSLCTRAFPGMDPNRLRVYELFCIHLGLATSPCVLEHTRRLAATIWEVTGPMDANPADLL